MTGCSSAPGVIPRAVSDIFSMIETTTNIENDVYFYVRLSYVELYNNLFRNLLEFASKDLKDKDKEKEKEKGDLSTSQSSREESDIMDISLNTSIASSCFCSSVIIRQAFTVKSVRTELFERATFFLLRSC